jgi:tyrosyl-tRNA synthetase
MSSSDPNSKIDMLDSAAEIRTKIKKAHCEEGNITDNGVLAFVKAVLIPISKLRAERRSRGEPGSEYPSQAPFVSEGAPEGTVFSISRPEKWGGPVHYPSYEALEQDFAERKLYPKDLKDGVTEAIISLLAPIQKAFEESPEFQEAAKNAYPVEAPPVKEGKKKKVRNHATYNMV